MTARPVLVIHQMFADLPEPRVERTKRHQLLDLITIAVCAVVSGADDTWVDVQAWGEAKQDWLATFLERPNGIPSHDTLRLRSGQDLRSSVCPARPGCL